MSKRKTKSNRGGAREGAGRKPTGVVALHAYPQAATVKILREQSAVTGASIGQVIDQFVTK